MDTSANRPASESFEFLNQSITVTTNKIIDAKEKVVFQNIDEQEIEIMGG